MAGKSKALALPDSLVGMLAEADKQRGFPSGTMLSLMQQETGGGDKYITDPTTYHYGLNAEGKRVAGHTGKVSTAFGPFGILESTAADPGYGVKPLGDKKSLAEQIRFAGDYLAARSKQAGGLQAGLAGYGEGTKYAAQVLGRMGKSGPAAPVAPVQVATATPAQAPSVLAPVVQAEAQIQPPVMMAAAQPVPQLQLQAEGPDAWLEFQQRHQAGLAPVVQEPQGMAQATQMPAGPGVTRPDFMAALNMLGQSRPLNVDAFAGFGGFSGQGRGRA